MNILVIAEHNNTDLLPATLNTVNAAKQIGNTDLLVIGYNCQDVVEAGRKIEDAIYKPVWQFDSKWTCIKNSSN